MHLNRKEKTNHSIRSRSPSTTFTLHTYKPFHMTSRPLWWCQNTNTTARALNCLCCSHFTHSSKTFVYRWCIERMRRRQPRPSPVQQICCPIQFLWELNAFLMKKLLTMWVKMLYRPFACFTNFVLEIVPKWSMESGYKVRRKKKKNVEWKLRLVEK